MHWRWLLPLPIAAFLCGETVRAPRLLPEIPRSAACPGYAAARDRFLLAYAFARDEPATSRALLSEMDELLAGCGEASALRARATKLKLNLIPSGESGPNRGP